MTTTNLKEFLNTRRDKPVAGCAKYLGTVGEDQHEIEMIISDNSVDRHGDVIDPKGWDLSHYNGVVLWNHNSNLPPIGKASKTWVGGDQLRQIWQSVPKDIDGGFAEMIAKMVKGRFIRDASVGFLIKEYEIAEDRDRVRGYPPLNIKSAELVENSVLNIGANRNTSSKSLFDQAAQKGIDTTPMAERASLLLDMGAKAMGLDRRSLEALYFEHRGKDVTISTPPSSEPVEVPAIKNPHSTLKFTNALRQQIEIEKALLEF